MSLVFQVLAVTLGIVSIWGLLAPRSQWKILTSWSVADPRESEPGPIAFGLRRFVYGLGAVSLVLFGIGAGVVLIDSLPKPPPPVPPIELMWGTPEPTVVNRVITTGGSVQTNLVEQPILSYQAWEENMAPLYLFDLKEFTRVGMPLINGYIGAEPEPNYVGMDTADLVVHVRGDLLCVPRASVVSETDTTVQIAIYYGLPLPPDGTAVDNLAGCSATPGTSLSLLIPINLHAPVGDREVQTISGDAILETRDAT